MKSAAGIGTGPRGSGQFREAGWPEALEVVARLGCDTEFHIREARRRGVDMIVVDPRRSATAAKLGTRWIPVRPGGDAALMMAVLHVLLSEGLVDRACPSSALWVERRQSAWPSRCSAALPVETGV